LGDFYANASGHPESGFSLGTATSALDDVISFFRHTTKTVIRIARAEISHGCQMAKFQTKNPNLGRFWRVLQWKMLVYLMAIWSISANFVWHFGKFCGHLVYFPRFGILYHGKSGNPGNHSSANEALS
jgi:hypothetical protein